jgi:hypothetical protein
MSSMPSPNDYPGNPTRYWVMLGEWQRQRIAELEGKLCRIAELVPQVYSDAAPALLEIERLATGEGDLNGR